MVEMDAVVEVAGQVGAAPWEVASGVPAYGWVRVSGRMTAAEVGTVLATMAVYGGLLGDEGAAVGAAELVRGLLAVEKVIAPGGLRVRDEGTGAVVVPGCCSGLEDWREWCEVADGGEGPWLGHDPAPWFERDGAVVRVWPDGPVVGPAVVGPQVGPPVEIAPSELPGLLAGVQRELRGFLARTEEWAARHAPGLGASLVAKLDADLGVGGGMALPG
ncbi:hypothetical protein AB0399_39840 [Streptomyces sp. NPDC088194]|uniref:hypothetical protein n=1 Tax=Streptomyces sp. NPDC088194 TaxID=3154931 RepID=UPI00344BC461